LPPYFSRSAGDTVLRFFRNSRMSMTGLRGDRNVLFLQRTWVETACPYIHERKLAQIGFQDAVLSPNWLEAILHG
jgi:hypothetical protein